MCCTAFLLLVAWLRQSWPGSRAEQISCSARDSLPTLAWSTWGAALGGFGYLAVVAIAMSSGWVIPTSADFSCIGSADASPQPVAMELVAAPWLQRSMLLLLLTVAALALAVFCMLATNGIQALVPQRHWMLMGAGLQWIVLSLLDHHVFGLYALQAPGDTGHWLVHGMGLSLIVLAVMDRTRHPPKTNSLSANDEFDHTLEQFGIGRH